jgi:hypothetical protein
MLAPLVSSPESATLFLAAVRTDQTMEVCGV